MVVRSNDLFEPRSGLGYSPEGDDRSLGSSAESVGELRLRKCAKSVIGRGFSGFEGAKAVGFSGGQFCFGVEALYHATGELPGSEFTALGYRQARRVDQSRPLGLSWGSPDGG